MDNDPIKATYFLSLPIVNVTRGSITFCFEAVSTTLFQTAFRSAILESIPLSEDSSREGGLLVPEAGDRVPDPPEEFPPPPESASSASHARAVSAPTGETGGVGVALGVGVGVAEFGTWWLWLCCSARYRFLGLYGLGAGAEGWTGSRLGLFTWRSMVPFE